MSERRRHTIVIGFVVLISLTLLAAPARGDDWFSLYIGGSGFGVGFGSTDWAVYGSSWSNPGWSVDYHVALSGYGEWVWIDGLGQCWRPWVRPDWRPFTFGRWVWTSWGWTWVAYEPWGYFPHHFGNWAMSPLGWVWHPGTVYSPANVVWVSAGSWLGWYPRAPLGWSHSRHGFGAGYAHGVHDGYRSGYRDGAADGYWAGWNDARYATYVSWDRFGDDDLGRHAVGAAEVRSSHSHAVPRSAAAAPDRADLARRGVAVTEMTLERRTVRLGGRDIELARPREAATSIGRNARTTVERALAPEASATLDRRAAGSHREPSGVRAPSGATAREQRAPQRGSVDGRTPTATSVPQRPSRTQSSSTRSGNVERSGPAPVLRPELTPPPQRSTERRATDRAEQRVLPTTRSATSGRQADERRQNPGRSEAPPIAEHRARTFRPGGSAKAPDSRSHATSDNRGDGVLDARNAAVRRTTEHRSAASGRNEASRRTDSSPSNRHDARRSTGRDDDRRGEKERSGSHRR